MPARLRRSGIQRRIDICKAREIDPDLTYRELQKKFLVSSRIVADALKVGLLTWKKMLATFAGSSIPPFEGKSSPGGAIEPPVPFEPVARPRDTRTPGIPPQYLSLTIEPLAGRGDPAPFRYRATDQDWLQADTPGIDGLLAELATKGWDLVYMGRIGLGHGTTAFGSTYECVFKASVDRPAF